MFISFKIDSKAAFSAKDHVSMNGCWGTPSLPIKMDLRLFVRA